MSAKFFLFPRNPEYRAELAAIPAEKRKKLIRLYDLRRRILQARLKRILGHREARKKNIDFKEED